MACCDSCAKTGNNCRGNNMMRTNLMRPSTLGAADYCPPGTVRSGNSCYATSRDRIYTPPSTGSGGGGWSTTVLALGSQALNLVQQRMAQGNYQPFQTQINGQNYLINPQTGTAQSLGAGLGSAAGTLGQSFSSFVQGNPLLVLGIGAAVVLLFMKPPSRRR